MRKKYYHKSFEYAEEYDFEALGETGIDASVTIEVCPTCGGTGRHFRKDLDENHLVDSFMEDGDYEGYEAYMGGAFDTICTECNGRNVVDVVDVELLPEWARKCISDWEHSEYVDRMIHEAEMRAERGWRY